MVSTRASSSHHDIHNVEHEQLNDPTATAPLPTRTPRAVPMDTILRQIQGLTDTVQQLLQQQQAISQLVGSQINQPKEPKRNANPQSSGVKNDDTPAAQDDEQVAESGTLAQSARPDQAKLTTEEELEILLGETGPPFSEDVMRAQPPKGFSLPKLDLYSGKTDPTEHLSHYRHAMALYSHSDAIMCRAFSNTLSESALSWFKKLPPRSVPTFADLGVKFINQFLTSKKVKKGPDHMLTIRQGKGESLRSYIARFNAELHNVEDCELRFATSALKAGLTTGPFLHSITKNKPKDHAELLARANKYIQVEDLDQSRHELRSLLESRQSRKESKDDRKRPRSPEKILLRRADVYTPLNASLSQILHQTRGREDFKWPPRLKGDPQKRDR